MEVKCTLNDGHALTADESVSAVCNTRAAVSVCTAVQMP